MVVAGSAAVAVVGAVALGTTLGVWRPGGATQTAALDPPQFVEEAAAAGIEHRYDGEFRFFVGGPLGSGRHYMSWIHRHDWVEMVKWIIETAGASGPFNLTAPHPVTNREFTRALGRALKRPALVRAPKVALKIALGEFADYVVTGQRVLPAHAQALGYHFRYPEIDIAFRGIFGD